MKATNIKSPEKTNPNRMSKYEFTKRISEKTGFTLANSEIALEAVLEVIEDGFKEHKEIFMGRIGKFLPSIIPAKHIKSVMTGEEIATNPSKTMKFKISPTLKNEMNGLPPPQDNHRERQKRKMQQSKSKKK